MRDAVPLNARSAFEGLLHDVGPAEAPGVVVRERAGLEIATVIARGGPAALAARVRSAYGIDLPSGPKRAASDRVAFVATGPRTWLALGEAGERLSDELQRKLADTAAVCDQSYGYAVMRLWGDKVRATFEKGLGIDLHPRAFAPGDAAATACAHIGVIVWQLDASPTYEIAVVRSLAAAFWHWLSESAAEFGVRVEAPG
jgi:methylglutamate dehydrogenase subunit D